MKSIEARFEQVRGRNPNYSAYSCFVSAIKGQQFSRKALASWFNKLVPESEYGDGERKETLDFLMTLNNELRKEDFRGKTMQDAVICKLSDVASSLAPKKLKRHDFDITANELRDVRNSISIPIGIHKK